MKISPHRFVLAALYLFFLGLAAHFAWSGRSYYLTPLAARPRHPLFWSYKPGGEVGHALGVLGTVMMVAMLAYSLRKRWPALRRLGPTSAWLDYHILLGICGPIFIVLHTSLKVQGLVALSFWSMVAVAASGVLGRYLYRQIPRSREGDELSLGAVEQLDRELARQLVEELSLPTEALRDLDDLALQGLRPDASLFHLAWSFPLESLTLRLRLRRFRREHPGVEPRLGRLYTRTLRRKALLRRRILLWQRLREVFHYWHVLHKPFAVVMYLFLVVHVAVAWATGYGW